MCIKFVCRCPFLSICMSASRCDARVFLPFVLLGCHFWQLLTVKDFEDVTAAKCLSLASSASARVSPLLSAQCPALLTSRNNLTCAFDAVRGSFSWRVSHLFLLPSRLLCRSRIRLYQGSSLDALSQWKCCLCVFEREIKLNNRPIFLFYTFPSSNSFLTRVLNPCWMNTEKTVCST